MFDFTAGLHRLMFGLLYPAVLGTVFVVFISQDFVRMVVYPRLVFGLVFLFHWCASYMLYTREGQSREYSVVQFLTNVVLLVAMYMAFATMPDLASESRNYAGLYFWVMVIGVAFLSENLLRRFIEKHRLDMGYLVVDSLLVIWGLSFLVLEELMKSILVSNFATYVFIFGTLAASLITLGFSRNIWVRKKTPSRVRVRRSGSNR